jgi:hypothetical protein
LGLLRSSKSASDAINFSTQLLSIFILVMALATVGFVLLQIMHAILQGFNTAFKLRYSSTVGRAPASARRDMLLIRVRRKIMPT